MQRIQLSTSLLALTLAIGCGGGYAPELGGDFGDYPSPDVPPGGGYGATPGGAQDIGYARQLIDQGNVPTSGDIPIEGLLSEHDIAPLGPPCESLLCARPALGIGPDLATGELAYWVQLGMSSGLSPASFVRPPLDVVVAIDKSSSMSIDMVETNQAVKHLIDNLRDDDRLAILTFDDSVQVLKSFGPVGDRAALKSQVDRIVAYGSWNIQAGTEAAYRVLMQAERPADRLRRVMVFSCGYPGLEPGGSDPYSQLVHDGAAQGIGLSFFGVLLGYHPDLANLLGREKGGAYYFLESLDRVVQVFDDEFDTMVTPLAYDLGFSFTTGAEFTLAELHGVPGDDAAMPAYEFDVATAFLSKRRGAIVARLERTAMSEGTSVGSVSLSYTPEPALGWTSPTDQIDEILLPAEHAAGQTYYQGPGVRKAIALVNMGQQMRAACDAYHDGNASDAIAMLQELSTYLTGEATALNDAALQDEVTLIAQLIANMS